MLLAKIKPEITIDSAVAIFDAFSLVISDYPSELCSGYKLRMTSESAPDIFEVATALYETGAFVYSIPNLHQVARRTFFPNDQYFNEYLQWHLFHSYWVGYGKTDRDIDMHLAWEYAIKDTSPIIAFIDGAFDLDHNDLDENKLYEPYDVVGDEWTEPLEPDFDPRLPTNGNEAYSYYWHGTSCLGIVSARTHNYVGMAGIASKFRYMPIKDSDDNFGIDMTTIEVAWRWAINHNASVIGLSSTYFEWSENVNLAIREAYSAGIGVFIAAGNNGVSIEYPATLPEVMAIGATDPNDSIASFSSRGPGLDIVAPGIWIGTLDVRGQNGYSSAYYNCEISPDYFCRFGGTSAAAPQVAAVAAMVLSRRPDLSCDTCTAEGLYEVMRRSSEDTINVADPLGYDYLYGWGRLNAARALLAVVRGDADNNGLITISDVNYLINYIFAGGPAPVPQKLTGDADGNGIITISDASFIINYIFAGGPRPPISFSY